MKYQTYIFDLDGTLLDTLGDLAASCNYALRMNGMPERSTDEVRQFVGNGVAKLIERAVPEGTSDEKREAVLQSFRRYYLEHAEDTTLPYDGILPMLQMLREKGCRVAVVSNKFMAATQALCRHYFGDLVEVAIGENEHIRKKPHPDAVEEALRHGVHTVEVTADTTLVGVVRVTVARPVHLVFGIGETSRIVVAEVQHGGVDIHARAASR